MLLPAAVSVLVLDASRPAWGGQGPPVTAAADRRIDDIMRAYAAGDDTAAERLVVLPGAKFDLGPIKSAIRRNPSWSRSTAAFLLEAASLHPLGGSELLHAGRSMVMKRPLPLGADADEDRFEVLWHQTALGLAQRDPDLTVQEEYLDAILSRFDGAAERGVRLETRFALARAIVAATACCWKPVAGAAVRRIENRRGPERTIGAALALFEQAATVSALRAEALVRGGVLLQEADRNAEAIDWFARVPVDADQSFGYVHHLSRARAFDRLNRPEEAASAYATALSFAESDQRASIGLAAALLRSGRPDEAVRAAAIARRAAPAGGHLSAFQRADLRFVPGWLSEIRRLRR